MQLWCAAGVCIAGSTSWPLHSNVDLITDQWSGRGPSYLPLYTCVSWSVNGMMCSGDSTNLLCACVSVPVGKCCWQPADSVYRGEFHLAADSGRPCHTPVVKRALVAPGNRQTLSQPHLRPRFSPFFTGPLPGHCAFEWWTVTPVLTVERNKASHTQSSVVERFAEQLSCLMCRCRCLAFFFSA